MTHAEEIATIRQNHREDLQLIFGEIKSVKEDFSEVKVSMAEVKTGMGQMVKRDSIVPLIADETKKQFALHVAECDNKRRSTTGGQKHDWFKIVRNTAYLAAIGGSITTAILASL